MSVSNLYPPPALKARQIWWNNPFYRKRTKKVPLRVRPSQNDNQTYELAEDFSYQTVDETTNQGLDTDREEGCVTPVQATRNDQGDNQDEGGYYLAGVIGALIDETGAAPLEDETVYENSSAVVR